MSFVDEETMVYISVCYFQLLENALRKYPSSTPERWDKIAEEVPGRTKKECMRRYKVRCTVEMQGPDLAIARKFLGQGRFSLKFLPAVNSNIFDIFF